MSSKSMNGHIEIPAPPVDPIPRPPSPPPDADAPPPPPDVIPPPPADHGLVLQNDRPSKQKKGWGVSNARATPLSVEELLKKKREADLAASKPKFLSKAERERLALEKRAKEVELQNRS